MVTYHLETTNGMILNHTRGMDADTISKELLWYQNRGYKVHSVVERKVPPSQSTIK